MNNVGFLEEVSIQALDVNSSQYIFVSNGAGDLLLLRNPHNSEHQAQLVMKTKAFNGKPFHVLAAHYDPKNMEFRCAVRNIDDTSLASAPKTNQNITFVPSSDDPMKEEVDNVTAQRSLEYTAPTTASKVQTRFCLAVLVIRMSEAADSVELYRVTQSHVLIGLAELQHFAFSPSGRQFTLISSSPFLPFKTTNISIVDSLKSETEVRSPFMNDEILDPEELKKISERLDKYTSEKVDENPLMNMTASGMDYDDDREELDAEKNSVSLYHYTLRVDGSFDVTHEQSLRPCEVMSLDTVNQVNLQYYKIGLSLDVDCVLFHFAFNKEFDADPTVDPIIMNHVAAFDALAFVSKAKENKKFLTVTSDNQHAILVEHKKFVYIYKHRPEGEHKAQHQVVDFGLAEFIGVRTLAGGRFALLTKDTIILCQL
jgi:hypothetical protein